MPDSTQMADDLGARRSAGLAGDDGAQPRRLKAFGSFLIWVDLPVPSPPSKVMKRPRPGGSSDRALCHDQSFSAPARNMPMTSSLAPSIARRMVEPVPTASAA